MAPGATEAGPDDTVKIGVIGCGYWGPNHIRSFLSLHSEGARMVMAADPDPARREHVSNMFPGVTVVSDSDEIISNPDIDAVVLATPARMHFEQAHMALEAGKHVLVEKPLTTNLAEARELAELAADHDRVLMVGHTYQYAGAIGYIRDAIADGELGKLTHIRSLRLNLGLFRSDIDVLWDLAPHDLSILLHVLDRLPRSVQASARARVDPSVYDIANLTLGFGNDLEAHIIVSWLDPQKVRQMTIVGDRKMLVYDDMSGSAPIQIFDAGIESPGSHEGDADVAYSYRRGSVLTPTIDRTEPLLIECQHFVECCKYGKTPDSGAGAGAAVTAIIEAAQRSIRLGGRTVDLDMFQGVRSVSDWLDAASGSARSTEMWGSLRSDVNGSGPNGRTSAEPVGGVTRFKAMVVDADDSTRLFAADALTNFEPGFDVVTVSDIEGAQEWIQSFVPDLLIVSESIEQQTALELIDLITRSSDNHRCRVVSIGHDEADGGAMAPWHHVTLDKGAGLAEWLTAVGHVFDLG